MDDSVTRELLNALNGLGTNYQEQVFRSVLRGERPSLNPERAHREGGFVERERRPYSVAPTPMDTANLSSAYDPVTSDAPSSMRRALAEELASIFLNTSNESGSPNFFHGGTHTADRNGTYRPGSAWSALFGNGDIFRDDGDDGEMQVFEGHIDSNGRWVFSTWEGDHGQANHLTASQIVRLPHVIYAREDGVSEADATCGVCQCEYVNEQILIRLPCRHCFHQECVTPWLESHDTCPMCRAQVIVPTPTSAEKEGDEPEPPLSP